MVLTGTSAEQEQIKIFKMMNTGTSAEQEQIKIFKMINTGTSAEQDNRFGDCLAHKGTSAEQDNRYSDKEKKLLKQMKFDDCLAHKVDMTKVKLDVIKPWIAQKITEILGMEDDVVVEFVFNQLDFEKHPDPKKMQINLTGFLNGKNARNFMSELWELLLSAQDSVSGIPGQFLDQKKDEIKKRMGEQDRVQEALKNKLEKVKL